MTFLDEKEEGQQEQGKDTLMCRVLGGVLAGILEGGKAAIQVDKVSMKSASCKPIAFWSCTCPHW